MGNFTQTILANVLVGIAVLYLAYRAYLKAKNKDHSSCGGCSKCSASTSASTSASNIQSPRPAPQATALITLERPKPKNIVHK
jgi:FeoB-associated Cys-rich membrane protein